MTDVKTAIHSGESRHSKNKSARGAPKKLKSEVIESSHEHPSLVRAVTPDDEISLDYVEAEDPIVDADTTTQEIKAEPAPVGNSDGELVGGYVNMNSPPASPSNVLQSPDVITTANDFDEHHHNNHVNEDEVELQSPDDEVEENLELRSLNDDPIGDQLPEEDGEIDHGELTNGHENGLSSSRDRPYAEAVSDDEFPPPSSLNDSGGRERRRPRTPLSPCPDTVSQNGEMDEDLGGVDEENEMSDDEFAEEGERREIRRVRHPSDGAAGSVHSRLSRRSTTGDRQRSAPRGIGEVPEAYRRVPIRRRARGGRKVRMRQEAAALHRSSIDSRLVANRRNRILRLREAQSRRIAVTRVEPPVRVPARREPLDSSRRPAGRWPPLTARRRGEEGFDLDEYLSRRNPSYYPPRRSRSPFSSSGRLPVVGRRERERSPIPPLMSQRIMPVRRESLDRDRRLAPIIPSRRSRSPRERLPYRPLPARRRSPLTPPVRRRSPLIASTSRYHYNDDRRRNAANDFPPPRRRSPVASRYNGGGGGGPRFRDLPSERVRNFDRRFSIERSRAPLPPPSVKRWRCPKRETTPVEQ